MKDPLEQIINTLFNKLSEFKGNPGLPFDLPKKSDILNISKKLEEKFREKNNMNNIFNNDFNNFFSYLIWFSYGLKLENNNNIINEYKRIRENLEVASDFASNMNKIQVYLEKEKIYQELAELIKSQKQGRIDLINEKNKEYDIKVNRSFIKKVNLFNLIDYLENNYKDKFKEYKNNGLLKNEIVNLDGSNIEIKAYFNKDFYDNIFNNYDQYEKNKICIFNNGNHSIASYLHSAHKHIHYLNISIEGKPIGTVILMEGEGEKKGEDTKKYLIVEGLLGNLTNIKEKEKIYDFILESVKSFAKEKELEKIFFNASHSGHQKEPEEFLEYTAKKAEQKYKFDNTTTFDLQKPKNVYIYNTSWFTHNLTIERCIIPGVSHIYKKNSLYDEEQYADTFYLYYKEEKGAKNPFNKLIGYAKGFEIEIDLENKEKSEVKDGKKPKKKKTLSKILGFGLPLILLGGYAYFVKQNEVYYWGNIIDKNNESDIIHVNNELNNILKDECNGLIESGQIKCKKYDSCILKSKEKITYRDRGDKTIILRELKCIPGYSEEKIQPPGYQTQEGYDYLYANYYNYLPDFLYKPRIVLYENSHGRINELTFPKIKIGELKFKTKAGARRFVDLIRTQIAKINRVITYP